MFKNTTDSNDFYNKNTFFFELLKCQTNKQSYKTVGQVTAISKSFLKKKQNLVTKVKQQDYKLCKMKNT